MTKSLGIGILTTAQKQKKIIKGLFARRAQRNFESYGHHLSQMNDEVRSIICDPQTSGGFLVMVSNSAQVQFDKVVRFADLNLEVIGEIVKSDLD